MCAPDFSHLTYVYQCFSVLSASTRKVYEKKLQKLLDEPAAEPEAPTDVTTLPKVDSNQNGNTNSDQYSDKEDGEFWSHVYFSLLENSCTRVLCKY